MAAVFNKVTYEWKVLEDTSGLSSDWVIDPVFTDKARADFLGPKYWKYSGNEITAMTDEEIDTDPAFLLEAKTRVKKEINTYRQEWMSEYFTYDSKTWNSDEEARNNIVGIVLTGVVLGNTLPADYTYRDYTNVDHIVTFMYMVSLGIALSTFRKTVYVVSQQKKDYVDSLTSVSAINSYDYSTGWPSK